MSKVKYLLNCKNFIFLMMLFSFFDNFVMGSNENLYAYKIILLGDSSVGKTSIIEKIINDDDKYKIKEKNDSTIGINKVNFFNVNNKKNIIFWDTAGLDHYNCENFTYLNKSDFIILVYDITNRKSFDSLSFWMNQIKENKEDAKILLVGNKCDVSDKERKVAENELKNLIKEYKEKPEYKTEYKNIVFIDFFEISAKSGKNIKVLWKNILEKIKEESLNSSQDFISSSNNEVCSCCSCC